MPTSRTSKRPGSPCCGTPATPTTRCGRPGIDFAVLELFVRYRRPLYFDDAVDIHVAAADLTRTTFQVGYLLEVEGQTRATAVTVHGAVDPEGRPARMPSWLPSVVAGTRTEAVSGVGDRDRAVRDEVTGDPRSLCCALRARAGCTVLSGRPGCAERTTRRTIMTIAVGDKIPDIKVMTSGPDGPVPVQTGEVLGTGKVVLFAVPGAFTPTCSDYHLPSYVIRHDELKAKGVDTVACISVNDPFVMDGLGARTSTSATWWSCWPTGTASSPRPSGWRWTEAASGWAPGRSATPWSSRTAW